MDEIDPYRIFPRHFFHGPVYECSSIADYLDNKDSVDTSGDGKLFAILMGSYYFIRTSGDRGILEAKYCKEHRSASLFIPPMARLYKTISNQSGKIGIEDPFIGYVPEWMKGKIDGSLIFFNRPGGRDRIPYPFLPVLSGKVLERV